MGGPEDGWAIFAKQPHTQGGAIQDRLNKFLVEKTGKAESEIYDWARKQPDELLPWLRDFYKNEGIQFPY
jgi:hypothetical protein